MKNGLKVTFEKICDIAGNFSTDVGTIKELKKTVTFVNIELNNRMNYFSERFGYDSAFYERGRSLSVHNSELYKNKRWVDVNRIIERSR